MKKGHKNFLSTLKIGLSHAINYNSDNLAQINIQVVAACSVIPENGNLKATKSSFHLSSLSRVFSHGTHDIIRNSTPLWQSPKYE
jgi:hypothetical protein